MVMLLYIGTSNWCRNSVNCGKILREQDTKHTSNRYVAKGNAGGIVKSLVIGQSAAKCLYLYR